MRIIDITVDLNEDTETYESDPEVRLEEYATIAQDGYAVTQLVMGSHSGTHIDAPSHVIENGKTADQIPLKLLVGKCYVVDASDFKIPKNAKRILVKGNTEKENTLNTKQARALKDAGVRVVGTDGLSIGNDKTHEILLGGGCAIMEVLDLSQVAPGPYFLCALPLKMPTDGAPMRACLIDQYQNEI